MVTIENPHEYFYASNGAVLKNLADLATYLKTVDRDSFAQHVNEGKNDFSNWIHEILKKKALAKKLQKLHDPDEFLPLVTTEANKKQSKQTQKKQHVIAKIKEAFV